MDWLFAGPLAASAFDDSGVDAISSEGDAFVGDLGQQVLIPRLNLSRRRAWGAFGESGLQDLEGSREGEAIGVEVMVCGDRV